MNKSQRRKTSKVSIWLNLVATPKKKKKKKTTRRAHKFLRISNNPEWIAICGETEFRVSSDESFLSRRRSTPTFLIYSFPLLPHHPWLLFHFTDDASLLLECRANPFFIMFNTNFKYNFKGCINHSGFTKQFLIYTIQQI